MDNDPKVKINEHTGERELKDHWCVWERYQTSYIQNKANYLESNQIIYEFSNLSQFASFWKNTNYNKCSSVFYNKEEGKIRKILMDSGEENIVECLMLFKRGIEPKWEDPANQYGGSLIVELKETTNDQLDEIWKNIVFALIGHNFPFSECVNGFRLLDRIKKLDLVKFEIWINKGLSSYKKTDPIYQKNYEIKEAITKRMKDVISKTVTISEYSIIYKDHYTANKV
jgi:hypothetical protein